jgi:hypothetical protein
MVNDKLIKEVKKKREFSKLPDSIIERVALSVYTVEKNISSRENELYEKIIVKKTREQLRKYFGVFLTNKVLKPKDVSNWKAILSSHISSKKRDYKRLYYEIFKSKSMKRVPPIKFNDGSEAEEGCNIFRSVVDLGSGVNGFSIFELHELTCLNEYYGIEASGQIVDLMNEFFDDCAKGFEAHAIWLDLFNIEEVKKIIRGASAPRAIFCFQVIDALEAIKKDFSKKFISEIVNELDEWDIFVLSFSTRSISGRKGFEANRKWLIDYLKENFEAVKDFEMFDERFFVFRKK